MMSVMYVFLTMNRKALKSGILKQSFALSHQGKRLLRVMSI